ncbi:heme ABC transporter ATP-binding protein [Bosea sp. (in: a-proteobacteria)]|uniref:heme ABC transporter ATP-binding protein n=1 Tax=Bosea sp. (in: a-proteobacteria) TaxID=1871050 RepID=UPI0025C56417|nr:heme ABC transporter ATP-binding protein [Bosea sp. (in: a-proteobacteria)]MBR3192349.1 heme ABC transporter ATP-binding protein [Bosea sp. (in: a-proteobacteria)]
MAILEADDLSFSVRGSTLVRGASLALQEGTTTIVVGPNGAGKSTLLKLLTGELSPSQGTVRMDGATLPQIPAWELACRRAVMVQNQRLAFPFTVYEVARLGLEGVGRAQSRIRKSEIIAQALETAGVVGLAGRQYQTLSGGEQQRVQFARALCQLEAGRSVAQRQILFLDEPIASLDLCHQLSLLDAARSIAAQGAAVLVVLHDLNLAVTYADRLVVMHEGAIVAQGDPSAILDDNLLRGVFRVSLSFSRLPPAGQPFLLPQQHLTPVPPGGVVPLRAASA